MLVFFKQQRKVLLKVTAITEVEDLSWTTECEHTVAIIGRLPADCTVDKIKEEDLPTIGKLRLTPDQVLVCKKMTNLTTLLV